MNKLISFNIIPVLMSGLLYLGISLAVLPAYGQSQAVISGAVEDAESGSSLPGANVYIPGTQTGASTDSAGMYRLEVSPGRYQLIASFIGYQSDTLSINVEAGEIYTYNIKLQPQVLEGGEVVVYANKVERRVRDLANIRNERRKSLKNYSVTVHKLGLVYEIEDVKSGQPDKKDPAAGPVLEYNAKNEYLNNQVNEPGSFQTVPDTGTAIAYSERVFRQYYIAPNTFGKKRLANRSSDNFFSEYEVFSTGSSPLNLNEDEVDLNLLSEVVSVVGPISDKAPNFYALSEEPAGTAWPEGTTKIIVKPKSNIRPLFEGIVYVNNETNNVIGMDLKMNEAGEINSGIYSLTDFQYSQTYDKVEDYWLPVRTEIEGRIGIIGRKDDFYYRDRWNYKDYNINRVDLEKNDIPLSGIEVISGAGSRDESYWNDITGNYSDEDEVEEMRKAMEYDEKGFFLKLFMSSFRAYHKAPTALNNFYFTNVSDFYRLNRVEGHYVGVGLRTPASNKNFTYKASVGYATEADDWRYYLDALQFIPGTQLAVEGSYYNRLALQFGDYRYKVSPLNVDEFRYTLQTAISGFDPRNYFEREGFSAGLRYGWDERFFVSANYMKEEHRFLPIVAPQSLFMHFDLNDEQIDPNLNPRVGNTPDGQVGPDGLEGFTTGEFSGFEFQFHFDNRHYRQSGIFRNYLVRQFGWFTDHLAYWSDPQFGDTGSDGFDYFKYRSSIGMRLPVFSTHFLMAEMFVGGADSPLPAQMQLGSNGFYVEDYIRRRPFLTLGFNEGIGNRISVARVDYDLGSGLVRMIPIDFIRHSGIQVRLYGAAGLRHAEADLSPVTPWTNGSQEHIEVGVALTRIIGIFSVDIGFRVKGDAGESVGLTLII